MRCCGLQCTHGRIHCCAQRSMPPCPRCCDLQYLAYSDTRVFFLYCLPTAAPALSSFHCSITSIFGHVSPALKADWSVRFLGQEPKHRPSHWIQPSLTLESLQPIRSFLFFQSMCPSLIFQSLCPLLPGDYAKIQHCQLLPNVVLLNPGPGTFFLLFNDFNC